MNAVLPTIVLGSLFIRPNPMAPADAPERYLKECAGAAGGSERCAELAASANEVVLRGLLVMEALSRRIDKDLLHEAMKSELGSLQAVGLRGIGKQPIDNQDATFIFQALLSPFPGVRNEAFRLLRQATVPGSEKYAKWEVRKYQNVYSGSQPAAMPYVADAIPKEAVLGAPAYPGSDYVFFASGPRRAFFTSSDLADKVVAFFTKGGNKVRTLAELESPAAKKGPDPAEVMRRIQSGENPQKVVADLQAEAMAGASSSEWTKGIKGQQGVQNPRFVEIPAAAAKGVVSQPRVVVIFDDAILNKTAIVFPRPDPKANAAKSQTDIQQAILNQQVLSLPLPHPTAVDPTVR